MTNANLSCKQIVELMTGYLDGTLPAEQREHVARHLESCGGCTMVLDQFRDTIALSGQLTEEAVTPAQERTIREAFRSWRAGR